MPHPKDLLIAVVMAVMCVSVSCRVHSVQLGLEEPVRELVADGDSRLFLPITPSGTVNARDLVVSVIPERDNASGTRSVAGYGEATISNSPLGVSYRAGVMPGKVEIVVSGKNVRAVSAALSLQPEYTDRFADGIPDFLRLESATDREAFRRWFTAIAEREAVANKPSAEIKDCAALVRFSYREAMLRHDSNWANDFAFGEHIPAGDVEKYQFPYTPLGPRLFRTREGRFAPLDLKDGTFAEFADARTLLLANSYFVTRDVHAARPGDLIFFRQFEQHSPFHSMIFVGRSDYGPGDDWVVYHTGPDGKWLGEIRRVTMRSLVTHPDPRWRPLPGNRNFLGVYRWNILREAQ